jgi:hypothetical protein
MRELGASGASAVRRVDYRVETCNRNVPSPSGKAAIGRALSLVRLPLGARVTGISLPLATTNWFLDGSSSESEIRIALPRISDPCECRFPH